MESLYISQKVRLKLQEKHSITKEDVVECFLNRDGGFLEDTREIHKTDPATQWFIAMNNQNKAIKVVFMQLDDGRILLKTAYPANTDEIAIYNKHAY